MTETKTVLVVDDDWMNLELMEATLERGGYTCITADNINDGLNKALHEQPAVALLDVRLPGNKSGYDLCKQLKDMPETRHIIVIMLTAFDGDAEKKRAEEAGADAFLTRGKGGRIIINMITELLNRPSDV